MNDFIPAVPKSMYMHQLTRLRGLNGTKLSDAVDIFA